jgi:hypothetical protein
MKQMGQTSAHQNEYSTSTSNEKISAKHSLVDEQNPSYGLVTSSARVSYEFFWSYFLSKFHVVGHAKIVQ